MSEELNGIVINHKPISESSLKRLLLIFDKLYFLDPIENNFLIPDNVQKIKVGNHQLTHAKYGLFYNGENYRIQEDRLLDKFDYAINKGIIRVLDLRVRKFYEKNWLPLRLSYDFDNGNAELLNNFIPLTTKEKNFSNENGMILGGIPIVNGVRIYPDVPPNISFFSKEDNESYSLDHQISSIAGKFNRHLSISSEFNLIPIFINENLAKAYATKVEIAKNNQEKKLNQEFIKVNNIELNKVQFLLQKISEIILPDNIIENIPIRELIYARNNTYHECIKLRRKLVKSLKFLEKNKFDYEFINEVDKYMKLEIEPLMNEYQNKFLESLSRFLKYSLPLASVATGSLIGIQQSLSPSAIAYLSAISATAGSVTSDLSNYIIKRPSNEFNNTFSYFVNLRE